MKTQKIIVRAEGGIEPLGCYTSTDLKSAHLTREDHPHIVQLTQVGFYINVYYK